LGESGVELNMAFPLEFLPDKYGTGYFWVRQLDLDRTVETLEESGHSVQNQKKQEWPP